LLGSVDYLIPNENELLLLAQEDNIQDAAKWLNSIGVGGLIVTLGSKGVLVVEDDREIRITPHTVKVVDTTAAGDAFVGAFAVALRENKDALEATTWGNAAGALSVMTAGAQPSLPTRRNLIQFMDSHPSVLTRNE
jgi:ribokinase